MSNKTYHLERFARGVDLIKNNNILKITALLYILITLVIAYSARYKPFFASFQIILLSLLIGFIIVYLIGSPLKPFTAELSESGFKDADGNIPMIISKHYNEDTNEIIYEFFSVGISLEEWHKKKEKLETALNINILRIIPGKDFRHFVVIGKPANIKIPDYIEWNDDYLIDDDCSFLLGKSIAGDYVINLSSIPMWLIGGATGSGKSVLTKLICRQCLLKGINTIVVDFKGGVDYPAFYRIDAHFLTDLESLSDMLKQALDEITIRKQILSSEQLPNIEEHNRSNPYTPMQRNVIIFDEVAEVLDKNGLSKEQKQFLQEKIEAPLATIARQGRAVGMHLILSLQRPDADVLPGQIRSNITGRIAGRCNNNLSILIMDDGSAAEKIDPREQGLFLVNDLDKTIFRGYYTD